MPHFYLHFSKKRLISCLFMMGLSTQALYAQETDSTTTTTTTTPITTTTASTLTTNNTQTTSTNLLQTTKQVLKLNISPEQSEAQKDPWIKLNRKIFAFNNSLDQHVLLPVATAWHKYVPAPIDKGVTNFFANIKEPWSAVNQLLQGHPKAFGQSLARFSLNTMTSLGFYDLAKKQGLTTTREDFGQTLAVWGVPSGPYMMLPILGPSTLRDTFGTGADIAAAPASQIPDWDTYAEVQALQIVDLRADLIPLEKVIMGDRYTLLRDFWLQNRISDISNGTAQIQPTLDDSFGDDSEDADSSASTETTSQSEQSTPVLLNGTDNNTNNNDDSIKQGTSAEPSASESGSPAP